MIPGAGHSKKEESHWIERVVSRYLLSKQISPASVTENQLFLVRRP